MEREHFPQNSYIPIVKGHLHVSFDDLSSLQLQKLAILPDNLLVAFFTVL
jgi:hypothetical protein